MIDSIISGSSIVSGSSISGSGIVISCLHNEKEFIGSKIYPDFKDQISQFYNCLQCGTTITEKEEITGTIYKVIEGIKFKDKTRKPKSLIHIITCDREKAMEYRDRLIPFEQRRNMYIKKS